jgi:hypothetical protein
MRNCFVWICFLVASASTATGAKISMTVTEPSSVDRAAWPVTSGVPLAQGELRNHRQTALFDADGKELPLQTEVLSRWPDGTIRWLLVDFQVDLAANESQEFALRYGLAVRRTPLNLPQLVTAHPSHARLVAPNASTGPLRVDLSPDQVRLLDRIWLDHDGDGKFADSERITGAEATGVVLVTPDGKRHRADLCLANSAIEQHGPLRACLRIDGRHRAEDGSDMFSYVVRAHFYRGQPFFKLEYTFINDYQGELMAKVDSIELVCSAGGDGNQFVLNGQRTDGPARLVQVTDEDFEINGEASGRRAPGWAAIGSSAGGLAVGVHQFWQNWPKSLEVKPGELRVGLCPSFDAGPYDGHDIMEEAKHYYYLRDGVYTFKVGMARTHELWVNCYSGQPDAEKLANFYTATEKPLLAQCSPEYVCSTGVVGDAPPADPDRYHGYDAWLDAAFAQHLEDQETTRENGMLNFGDWFDAKKFGGGWGNQEYDTSHIFFTQYLRTGDRRYYDRARQGAWHLMDVDVLHAVNPHIRGLDHHGHPHPGDIWTHSVGHTGGYYSEAPLEAPWWYQLGMLENLGHVWIGGLADWYALSGNRRARDVGVLAADRLQSLCPTGYSDHIRGVGWPLNMLVTAYEMTGDDRYLDAAGRQWDVMRANLDPERGWVVMLAYGHCSMQGTGERCRGNVSYMLGLTLSALTRYHQITGDPEVLEAISIGLDQIIRECWHEEAGSFYATACTHLRGKPPGPYAPTTTLAALAFAHEYKLTGNQEHLRIFRKAFQNSVEGATGLLGSGNVQAQAGYQSRGFHFTPYSLRVVEDE